MAEPNFDTLVAIVRELNDKKLGEHAAIWRQAAAVVESMAILSQTAASMAIMSQTAAMWQQQIADNVPQNMTLAALEQSRAYLAAANVLKIIASEYERGA
jgi:hypothetical protein